MSNASRREAAITKKFLRGQGLTEPLSAAVWELDQPISLTELARRLNCQKQNVTQIADRLEALGVVVRNPHPSDRRVTLLSLTEAGRAKRQAVGRHLLTGYPLNELTDDEQNTLDRLLTKLNGGPPVRRLV